MTDMRKLLAEAIGTAWLVIGGCGTAILTGGEAGGLLGISLAFGLTVVTMAYAIGHISGCHLNPAVSIGLFMAKRFDGKDLGPYIAAQIAGGLIGAGVIAIIIKTGGTGTHLHGKLGAFAANGFGEHSPDNYKLVAALLAEAAMTFFFLFIILGATSKRAPAGFAPLAIGLCLTLIHLVSIPITNTSVNPARSTGPAIFQAGWALEQLWLFWVAPIVGAVVGGLVGRYLDRDAPTT